LLKKGPAQIRANAFALEGYGKERQLFLIVFPFKGELDIQKPRKNSSSKCREKKTK
jgi:hypothetical protein